MLFLFFLPDYGVKESWNHGVRNSRNQEMRNSGIHGIMESWNHGIEGQGPGIKGLKECQGRISSIHSIGPKVANIDLVFPIDRDKGRQAANLRNSATC